MPRLLKLLTLFLLVWFVALAAASALAQETSTAEIALETSAPDGWPKYPLDPQGVLGPHKIERGPGFYLSLVKIALYWLVFLAWVKTSDWVSQDCVKLRQNFVLWNSVVVFAFFAALLLLWILPTFWLGFPLLLIAYGAPLGTYIYKRNLLVDPHLRVLTKDHFRHLLAARAKKVGVSVKAEETFAYQKGAQVEFKVTGGATDRDNNANLLTARQSPAYLPVKELIDDAVGRRSDLVLLDYTRDAVAVRYQIDGVWHAMESRDRESGDAMLAVLKTLAALNPAERRQKQTGRVIAEARGGKYTLHLASQGVETGERVTLKLDKGGKKLPYNALEELGMRDKMRDQLLELLSEESGLVLFCTLPGGGLSTLFNVALMESDRLLRNYVAVEEASAREWDLENVEVTTYDAKAGQTPATVLPKMIRAYPDVIVVRDLADANTGIILCEQTNEKRQSLAGIRAKDSPEALLRVLLLKIPAATFAPAVKAVLHERLIRKLCPACKIAFEPTPEILQKLGIPPGRVQVLYREPRPDEVDENGKPRPVCKECDGLGFKGRTGIFELLVVDDRLREVLIKQPKLELVKKAAKLAGMRSLQEEGIVLVAKGVTSLPELMRVLKG